MSATEGYRFAVITADDHGAWIWISTSLSLTYAFLCLGVRGIVKWRAYGLDDAILVMAYILGLGFWISIFAALHHGLGKGQRITDASEEVRAAKLISAARILLYSVLCLSKCCVLLLIRRLFSIDGRKNRTVCYLALGVVLVWGIAAVLAVSVGCTPENVLLGDTNAYCSNEAVRWKTITAFDAITECLLVILPAYFISWLQIKLKRKMLVVIAFSFRLPVAVLSIVALQSYLNFYNSRNANIGLTNTISWQNALLSYSLMSATIPCLKGFIKSFTTAGFAGAINPSSSGTKGHDGSFAMGNVPLRPEQASQTTHIYHTNDAPRESVGSRGSKELIIRKVVEWEFHDRPERQ